MWIITGTACYHVMHDASVTSTPKQFPSAHKLASFHFWDVHVSAQDQKRE